ncbi:acyl-CoA dehydrogenase family protein [Streptomyces sp. NPDC058471]|uniref:acyl-CoA dehydrogenase family protein n=1 Tax=Streptomyces sp. NPDC058471 TaxID=3346516 RepID=UPI00364F7A45
MSTDFLPHPPLAEKHQRLKKQVDAFVTERIKPLVDGMEARGPHTDTDVREHLSNTGWLGLLIDTQWGGLDLGHVAKTVILREIARISPAAAIILQASELGASPIIEYGSADMQRTWLPEIAAGRCWPTIAVTDPNQGSHILGMEATARRRGQDYVLDGEKVLVGNSDLADIHCVVAHTGPPGVDKERSLTAFLVEKATAGLEIVPQRLNGLHGFSVDGLRMTGVRVPQAHIIGEVGDGLDVAQLSSVVYGRLNLSAVALGAHQRLLEETAQRVSKRRRYKGHLSDLDDVRSRVAEMHAALMAAELTAYHAAQLLDRGEPCDPWLYHAKLIAHRAGVASSEHAKQLYGGHAGRLGTPLEQFRRDIDLIHAPAGPDDLQLKRLAEFVLDPPRSQWSVRHAARRRAT